MTFCCIIKFYDNPKADDDDDDDDDEGVDDDNVDDDDQYSIFSIHYSLNIVLRAS